jgi:hypothetical protein
VKIYNLCARRKWVVDTNPRPLYTRERTPDPVEYYAGRAPEPVWTCEWVFAAQLLHDNAVQTPEISVST